MFSIHLVQALRYIISTFGSMSQGTSPSYASLYSDTNNWQIDEHYCLPSPTSRFSPSLEKTFWSQRHGLEWWSERATWWQPREQFWRQSLGGNMLRILYAFQTLETTLAKYYYTNNTEQYCLRRWTTIEHELLGWSLVFACFYISITAYRREPWLYYYNLKMPESSNEIIFMMFNNHVVIILLIRYDTIRYDLVLLSWLNLLTDELSGDTQPKCFIQVVARTLQNYFWAHEITRPTSFDHKLKRISLKYAIHI